MKRMPDPGVSKSAGSGEPGARGKRVYTKEELEEFLHRYVREHGEIPKKAELPTTVVSQIRREWGKWCYALEETGIKPASTVALERRERRRCKFAEKHTEQHKRRKR